MSDEPGDSRDSAEPDETVHEGPEGDVDAETEFHPFDEVDEDFQPGPAMRVTGPDGMPVTVDTTTNGDDIPALSTESLVCMADVSKFVMRDEWGEIKATFEPADVSRAPNGCYRVKNNLVREQGATNISSDEWVEVLPIRPQCHHYVRQQGSFYLNATHKKHYRLCSARRTTEGTFMTVSDLGMWACDMRHPYDVESIKRLDDFDKFKIEQGAKRTHLPIFQGFGIFDEPKRDDENQEN
jgi:hypothetical protein